jgi:hypothetical protein
MQAPGLGPRGMQSDNPEPNESDGDNDGSNDNADHDDDEQAHTNNPNDAGNDANGLDDNHANNDSDDWDHHGDERPPATEALQAGVPVPPATEVPQESAPMPSTGVSTTTKVQLGQVAMTQHEMKKRSIEEGLMSELKQMDEMIYNISERAESPVISDVMNEIEQRNATSEQNMPKPRIVLRNQSNVNEFPNINLLQKTRGERTEQGRMIMVDMLGGMTQNAANEMTHVRAEGPHKDNSTTVWNDVNDLRISRVKESLNESILEMVNDRCEKKANVSMIWTMEYMMERKFKRERMVVAKWSSHIDHRSVLGIINETANNETCRNMTCPSYDKANLKDRKLKDRKQMDRKPFVRSQ